MQPGDLLGAAKIRAAAGNLDHMPQGQIPAALGVAGFVKADSEQDYAFDLEVVIQLHIGRQLFIAGIAL